MFGIVGEAIADHQVAWHQQACVAGLRRVRVAGPHEQPTGVLGVLIAAQRLANRVTLRAQEREGHRAADHHHVGQLQEPVDHADLVGYLRPADDRYERWRGMLEDAGQRAHLAFEQTSRCTRQQVCHAGGAGVRTVRGAEGIVDIDVGELRQLAGKLQVVGGLSRLEAHILQEQDLAVSQLFGELARTPTHDLGCERHACTGELTQTLGHRRKRQVGLGPSLRASQVRDEHQTGAAGAQLSDRGQGLHDARVVGHRPCTLIVCGHRHVEVHSHEYPLAMYVELIDAPHRFCAPIVVTTPSSARSLHVITAPPSAKSRPRADERAHRTLCTRSTTRLE